jgi:hypothetical protein
VVNEHGDIQVRELSSGQVVRSWPGEQNELAPPWSERQNVAAVSADATTVATVLTTGVVRMTNVESGRAHDLPTLGSRVVTFSDQALLIGRTDNGIETWDAAGTTRQDSTTGDASYARALVAVPQQTMVARLTEQGTIELTDLDTHQVVGSLVAPEPQTGTGEPPWEATTLATVPSGQELITATGAGAINRWQLTPDAWIRIACASAGREINADEWRRSVGTEVPPDLRCLQ